MKQILKGQVWVSVSVWDSLEPQTQGSLYSPSNSFPVTSTRYSQERLEVKWETGESPLHCTDMHEVTSCCWQSSKNPCLLPQSLLLQSKSLKLLRESRKLFASRTRQISISSGRIEVKPTCLWGRGRELSCFQTQAKSHCCWGKGRSKNLLLPGLCSGSCTAPKQRSPISGGKP